MRQLIRLSATVLSVLFASSLLTPVACAHDAPMFVAHRGQSGTAPENTLLAFEEAVSGGADGVETDVRITADGVPILFHDKDVSRVTNGQGNVDTLTFEQISGLAILKHGLAISGARIPSLAEFVQFLSEHPTVQAYVEVKGYRNQADIDYILGIIRKCVHCKIRLSSFRLSDLLYIRRRDPHIPLDLILPNLNEVQKLEKDLLRISGNVSVLVFYREAVANRDLVAHLLQAGIGVGAWTVPDRDVARQLTSMGVSPIIADKPLDP